MIPHATSIKYMIGGYSAIFLMLGIYLFSLIMRWRKMKRDLHILKDVKEMTEESNKPK